MLYFASNIKISNMHADIKKAWKMEEACKVKRNEGSRQDGRIIIRRSDGTSSSSCSSFFSSSNT
jgi:hypothetical protein